MAHTCWIGSHIYGACTPTSMSCSTMLQRRLKVLIVVECPVGSPYTLSVVSICYGGGGVNKYIPCKPKIRKREKKGTAHSPQTHSSTNLCCNITKSLFLESLPHTAS